MQEYLNALVGVTLLGGLVRMLAPEGTLQKYLRLTIGLCLICALVQPLLGGVWEEGALSWEEWLSEEEYEELNYDEIYNQSLQNGAIKQAEILMKERIYKAFSFTEEDARISASFLSENGILRPDEVQVVLRRTSISRDPREIVSFVNAEWECSCVVIYE